MTIEIFDASGASLGNVDYSMYADTAAKIVVTTGNGDVFEYMIP